MQVDNFNIYNRRRKQSAHQDTTPLVNIDSDSESVTLLLTTDYRSQFKFG